MALKFESIKNLFITEEKIEETKVEEKVSNQEKTTVNQVNPEIKKEETSSGVNWKKTSSGNSVVSETVEAKQVAKGEINEQILDSLTKALMNANLPGEDYLEFMQAYRAMKDIPLEENIKVVVFATFAASPYRAPGSASKSLETFCGYCCT